MKYFNGRSEEHRVALYDKAHAALFERAYTSEDAAEALHVSVSTFTHLRGNLTAHAYSRRQAAHALLDRFLFLTAAVLGRTPDTGSTATTARHTLGDHLRRELAGRRDRRWV